MPFQSEMHAAVRSLKDAVSWLGPLSHDEHIYTYLFQCLHRTPVFQGLEENSSTAPVANLPVFPEVRFALCFSMNEVSVRDTASNFFSAQVGACHSAFVCFYKFPMGLSCGTPTADEK